MKFIPKQVNIPSCFDCVFNKRIIKGISIFDKCMRFRMQNDVSKMEYSIKCRWDENKCGLFGSGHFR